MSLFVIFTLRTRTVWVALFVMLMVAINYRRAVRSWGRYVCETLIVLFFFALIGAAIYFARGPKILSTASLVHRKDMWAQSLKMSKDNIISGVGPGGWRVAIPFYARYMSDSTREVAFRKIYFQRAHNDFLQVLTETGIFSFVAYLMIFGFGIWYAVKKKQVWLYAGIVGYMIAAFFSFPKERIYHSMWLMIALAIAVKEYHKPVKYKVSRRIVLCIGALLLFGMSFVMYDFYQRYRTEIFMHKLYQAKSKNNWKRVLELTDNISPLSTLDSFCTPIEYYRGLAYFSLKDFKNALRSNERAYRENPNHLYVLMNLGSCYTLVEEYEEAALCFGIANEMYPNYGPAIENFAQAKLHIAVENINRLEKTRKLLNGINVDISGDKHANQRSSG
ncbi:MAG: O-antigen ligase family protein, partial [Planctomycetota bacterium]